MVANYVRSERSFRWTQPACSAIVRRGKEGHTRGGQPRRLLENVQPLFAMDGGYEMSDQLQVHRLNDRNSDRRLHC